MTAEASARTVVDDEGQAWTVRHRRAGFSGAVSPDAPMRDEPSGLLFTREGAPPRLASEGVDGFPPLDELTDERLRDLLRAAVEITGA